MSRWGLLTALIICLHLSGCGNDRDEIAREFSGLSLSVEFDPEMDADDVALIQGDFLQLKDYEIQVSQEGTLFEQIFDSRDASGVVQYLDERVNFFIPEDAELEERILVQELGQLDQIEDEPQIAASNVGTEFWYISEIFQPQEVRFLFGDELIEAESSRIGIIQPGPAYAGGLSGVERVSTLVHEARHSDCTGGITRQDLDRVEAGSLPENLSCGHLHDLCPSGHPLEGLPGCDSHPWGAYSVHLVFMQTLAEECDGCTEQERQIALIGAADAASRVLVLEPMLAGALGPPDMSSSGVLN